MIFIFEVIHFLVHSHDQEPLRLQVFFSVLNLENRFFKPLIKIPSNDHDQIQFSLFANNLDLMSFRSAHNLAYNDVVIKMNSRFFERISLQDVKIFINMHILDNSPALNKYEIIIKNVNMVDVLLFIL